MTQERYEIEGNMFYVIDPELEIKEHHILGQCEKSPIHTCYRKDFQLHGPSFFYAPDKTLLSLTWYIRGKKVGKVHRYYSDGTLYALERYVAGKAHKDQEYYTPRGALKTKICFDNGRLHGETLLYWPDGKLKRRALYVNGEKQEESFFDELLTPLS